MPLLIVKSPQPNIGNCSVIIPAAGSGKRFGGDLPKQFLILKRKPIIIHTINIFDSMPEIANIVIPVNAEWKDYLVELLSKYSFYKDIYITQGGAERQDSIMNALLAPEIENSEIVLIHDAVRPFASAELVRNIIKTTKKYSAAIPATMPKETIKLKDNSDNVQLTFARSMLASVQTPQGFKRSILLDSYKKAMKEKIYGTDDASLVEHAGHKVKIIPGEEKNIKITTPLDFQIAELIMRNKW